MIASLLLLRAVLASQPETPVEAAAVPAAPAPGAAGPTAPAPTGSDQTAPAPAPEPAEPPVDTASLTSTGMNIAVKSVYAGENPLRPRGNDRLLSQEDVLEHRFPVDRGYIVDFRGATTKADNLLTRVIPGFESLPPPVRACYAEFRLPAPTACDYSKGRPSAGCQRYDAVMVTEWENEVKFNLPIYADAGAGLTSTRKRHTRVFLELEVRSHISISIKEQETLRACLSQASLTDQVAVIPFELFEVKISTGEESGDADYKSLNVKAYDVRLGANRSHSSANNRSELAVGWMVARVKQVKVASDFDRVLISLQPKNGEPVTIRQRGIRNTEWQFRRDVPFSEIELLSDTLISVTGTPNGDVLGVCEFERNPARSTHSLVCKGRMPMRSRTGTARYRLWDGAQESSTATPIDFTYDLQVEKFELSDCSARCYSSGPKPTLNVACTLGVETPLFGRLTVVDSATSQVLKERQISASNFQSTGNEFVARTSLDFDRPPIVNSTDSKLRLQVEIRNSSGELIGDAPSLEVTACGT